jgi:hypothetical protein
MNLTYVQTVNLLLDIAPTVFETLRFAMKGGHRTEPVRPGPATAVSRH